MYGSRQLLRATMIVAALALVASAPAGAQSSGAGDLKEISSYKLTDSALARYTQAQHNLESLSRDAAADCDNNDSDDTDDNGESEDSENGTTIDRAVAKLNSTAGVSAAVTSAGMTVREFVVFSMAMFQSGLASWALTQPGAKLPPGVSMDNVNFYRKHEAVLQKLGKSNKSANCDEE